MGSETASIIGAAIGGGLLVAVGLLAVAVRAGRLVEVVSRMEKESREYRGEFSRTWRDRCSVIDRRFAALEQRLDRSRGVAGDDD